MLTVPLGRSAMPEDVVANFERPATVSIEHFLRVSVIGLAGWYFVILDQLASRNRS